MGRNQVNEILELIRQERERQIRKWGQQDHADLPPSQRPEWIHEVRLIERTDLLRAHYEVADEQGDMNWAMIPLEEVGEAIDEAKAGSDFDLRNELIQVAAVAAAWAEAIERRSDG